VRVRAIALKWHGLPLRVCLRLWGSGSKRASGSKTGRGLGTLRTWHRIRYWKTNTPEPGMVLAENSEGCPTVEGWFSLITRVADDHAPRSWAGSPMPRKGAQSRTVV